MTCKRASCHGMTDMSLEEELCLEIARQFDEEDLTHPLHRLHDGDMKCAGKKCPPVPPPVTIILKLVLIGKSPVIRVSASSPFSGNIQEYTH